MNYISTRGYDRKYSAAEAIITGIAPDGGLFVPETIPQISAGEIEEMKNMQFFQISAIRSEQSAALEALQSAK